MCVEKVQIDAAPGANSTTTTAPTGPILTVNDPRLDVDSSKDPILGPLMQRRRKVLAVCGKLLPMAWKRTAGKDNPCELGQGGYKPMYCWSADWQRAGRDSCSSVNGAIMGTDGAGLSGPLAFDVAKRTDSGWVPYQPGGGLLPSVGDTYLLKKHWEGVDIYHSGIICHVELVKGGFWICADGGQTYTNPNLPPPDNTADPPAKVPDQDNQAAQLVPRVLICESPGGGEERAILHRYDAPKKLRYLYGWLDLGHPKVHLKGGGAYDAQYTEIDYRNFKQRILAVRAAVKS